MTDDRVSAHVVAAMLGLDAAEKAAACGQGGTRWRNGPSSGVA
jgi:hypothetical protein